MVRTRSETLDDYQVNHCGCLQAWPRALPCCCTQLVWPPALACCCTQCCLQYWLCCCTQCCLQYCLQYWLCCCTQCCLQYWLCCCTQCCLQYWLCCCLDYCLDCCLQYQLCCCLCYCPLLFLLLLSPTTPLSLYYLPSAHTVTTNAGRRPNSPVVLQERQEEDQREDFFIEKETLIDQIFVFMDDTNLATELQTDESMVNLAVRQRGSEQVWRVSRRVESKEERERRGEREVLLTFGV